LADLNVDGGMMQVTSPETAIPALLERTSYDPGGRWSSAASFFSRERAVE
jgi:hypothetical protein